VVTLLDKRRSYGGPVTVAINLAEEQVRQGDEVTLLSMSRRSENGRLIHSANGVKHVQFPTHNTPFFGGFSLMYSFSSAFWLLKNLNSFDIVHFHFSRDIFQVMSAAIARIRNAEYVIQPHGMLTNPEASSKPFQSLFDCLLVKPAMRKANKVLALQNRELQDLTHEYNLTNATILPNGVSFEFGPAIGAEGNITITFASRLHIQKNPFLFLETSKIMLGHGFRGTFLIAGPDGGLAQQVKDFVENVNSPSLRYLGALSHEQAGQLLRESNVLVLPSRKETFPMIVLEALAVGTPVALSSDCQIANIVIGNELGEVFEPNCESLENAINKLLHRNLSRTQIVQSAREIFDISEVVRKLGVLYGDSR
jgi:glycosyltransferase involved in cell wall biosynthesis